MRPIHLLLLTGCLAVASGLVTEVSQGSQGNKRHKLTRTVYEKKPEHGACAPRVASWRTWEGGFSGKIRVHTEDDPAVTSWEATLVLSKDVKVFQSHDGKASETSGKQFTVTNVDWNGKIDSGVERVFNVMGQFDRNEDKAPMLVSLKINNGETVYCSEEDRAEGEAMEVEKEEPVEAAKPAPENPVDPAPAKPAPAPVAPVARPTPAGKNSWPKRTLGLYILLADDTEEGFESESTSWKPELFEWQQEASNVLFFTFIHPETMDIPPSFKTLSDTRGSGAPGAVPKDTVIMFAIGGYSYSLKPNPWWWLESREAAEQMAVRVAKWYDDYNMDGIDLDLEEGAGAQKVAGPNMIHFIRKVKELQPNMIVSQPTYGYPQVAAENDVINASWDNKENSAGLADLIGLMVYEGKLALQYVKNFNKGSERWSGFPIHVNVPSNAILLGAKGATSAANLVDLANAAVEQDLAGIMVWYASIKNGFDYAPSWDASTVPASIEGYKRAMAILNADN